MKTIQEKRKKIIDRKSINLVAVEDEQFYEIRKEFFPKQDIKREETWICPICERPFHKKPGPFTCGLTVHRNEGTIALWVQSLGCCRFEQEFPIEETLNNISKVKEGLIPLLLKDILNVE